MSDRRLGAQIHRSARSFHCSSDDCMRAESEPSALPPTTGDPADADSANRARRPAMTWPPTEVDSAAVDLVSLLTAMQFGVYGTMFHHLAARFATAHANFVKSLVEPGSV